MDDNNLNNGLEDLLNMFRKMMESQDLDAIPGINEEQKEQLKMFLEDFDELKDDMKVEIYKLDPFTKQMVGMVMGQLKNFTGNPQQTVSPTMPQEPPVNKEKQLTDIPGTMMTTTKSERTTRVIDFDQEASMEQKKREGYF